MQSKPIIVADADIPFLKGRLEPFAQMVYAGQNEFTLALVAGTDALMIRTRTRCNRDLLANSNVKVIATATIGMDQFDLPSCKEMGIATYNAPGCNAPGVAQYVWSCLLREGLNPKELRLAVVGCGNVGRIVKQWGELLGAEVRVSDPPLARKGMVADYKLDDLLKWADAITFHTPYTRTGSFPTHHLLNENNVDYLRKGAIVINAARGPVTSTRALMKGIREKGIRAIIDCWEGEPEIDRELLSEASVATYHIAGYSLEGKQRATRMATEAIGNFFGFRAPVDDLSGPYVEKTELTPEQIIASFDPKPIMAQLQANPTDFDKLRANYKYRKEV